MTYVFNVFVMMQVFNFLNARKIGDELNIFAGNFIYLTQNNYFLGILENSLFLVIVFMIFFLQVFYCELL